MSQGNVTLLDAGMGKTLSMKGVEIPPTIWSANALLVAPEVVLEVHRENIEAGFFGSLVGGAVIAATVTDDNFLSTVAKVHRMGMTLGAEADNCDGLSIKRVEVRVFVVVNRCCHCENPS